MPRDSDPGAQLVAALGDEPEGETTHETDCKGLSFPFPLQRLARKESFAESFMAKTGRELLKQAKQVPSLLLWEPRGPNGTRPRLYCHVADSHKPRCLEQHPLISSQFSGSEFRMGLTGFSAQGPWRPKPRWWLAGAHRWLFCGGSGLQAHSSSWHVSSLQWLA